MKLTISGEDMGALKKVELLAKQLGLKISEPLPKAAAPEADKEALRKLMQEMSASGGIKSIENPIEWQRKVRKDRKLPGRTAG